MAAVSLEGLSPSARPAFTALADRQRIVDQLDGLMLPHAASTPAQARERPLHVLHRVVAARLAVLLGRLGRDLGWTATTVFDQRLAVPLGACWDIGVYGAYIDEPERRLVRYLVRTLAPGAQVIDAGANVGFFACLAARLVGGTGRVVAVEPDPRALAYLRRNAAAWPQLLVRESALLDEVGETVFFHAPGAAMVSSSTRLDHVTARTPTTQHVESRVAATTLDRLCAEAGVRPDLVKIDVEGAEHAVLVGAAATLREARPTLVLEIGFDRYHETYAPCVDLLVAHGYGIRRILADGDLQPIEVADLPLLGARCRREAGYLHDLDNIVFVPPETAATA
jgi:FkbM family methyltransferase